MDPVDLLIWFGLGAAVLWVLSQSQMSATVIPGMVSVDGGAMPLDSNLIEAKAQQLMQAIARAEGFGVPGEVPTLYHNPGDLGPGDAPGFNAVFHSGSNVVQFPDDATGWSYLHDKLYRILSGQSSTYPLGMSITQMAQKYAGNWQAWAANVAAALGVSPDTTLSDWLNM